MHKLSVEDLEAFKAELITRDLDEHCHKGRINAVAKEIRRRGSASAEIIAVENMAEDIVTADNLFGDGMPYDIDRIENEIRFYQDQAGAALLEMGKRFIRIKAHEEPKKFMLVVEKLGMAQRSVNYAMAAARRFSNSPTLANLEPSKMKALTVLDEDDIKTLESGGEVKGMTLDDIDRMTNRELRENLRKDKELLKKEKEARKKDRAAFEQSMLQKDAKINKLDMRLNGQEPPTQEQAAEKAVKNELEELRKKLFEEIQLTRFHCGGCLAVIGAAQKIEGVTFPMLEKWAQEEYAELAGFQPMLETLDEALRFVNPEAGEGGGSAD
jgi:hypothetical protein